MESIQKNEENVSNFLTYFNMLLLSLIMFNIIINISTEEGLAKDHENKNIFLPVRSTSVFMWGGLNNWAYMVMDTLLP